VKAARNPGGCPPETDNRCTHERSERLSLLAWFPPSIPQKCQTVLPILHHDSSESESDSSGAAALNSSLRRNSSGFSSALTIFNSSRSCGQHGGLRLLLFLVVLVRGAVSSC